MTQLLPFISNEALLVGISIGCWEVLKAIVGGFWQSRGTRSAAAKSLARTDIEVTQREANECLKKAIQFFTDQIDPAARSALARAIRHDIKCIATKFFTLDARLVELGANQLDQVALVSFRKALTYHLEDRLAIELPEGDPRIVAMYQANLELQGVLDGSRYKLT